MVSKDQPVLIVGGGIVGCSTAYYLSKAGFTNVIVIEAVDVAHAASGRAGGFLARDWCNNQPTQALAIRGFEIYSELTAELGVDIGYRHVNTLSLSLGSGDGRGDATAPGWVDGQVSNVSVLGTKDTTAQVHPGLATKALLSKAQEKGVKLLRSRVIAANYSENKINSLLLESGETVPGETVILTMGPWTGFGLEWFGKSKIISGERAHSIVLKPEPGRVDDTALFLSLPAGETEVYPRPDGTVYVCGQQDEEPLPADPALVVSNPVMCADLLQAAYQVSSSLSGLKEESTSACYLPTVKDHKPLVGEGLNKSRKYLQMIFRKIFFIIFCLFYKKNHPLPLNKYFSHRC